MADLLELVHGLGSAAASADVRQVKSGLRELDVRLLRLTEMDDALFEAINALFGDDAFLRLVPSWRLVTVLEAHWDLFSEKQREQLRSLFLGIFDRFRDSNGAFAVSELLGKHFNDESTLRAFQDLGSRAQMPARALVPHGLETLARETTNRKLRSAAVEELKRLAQSENEDVRCEALTSLAKVTRSAGQGGG